VDDDWIDPLLLMPSPEQRKPQGTTLRPRHYLAALAIYLGLVAINIFVFHAFS
jgi:hypothetical protein